MDIPLVSLTPAIAAMMPPGFPWSRGTAHTAVARHRLSDEEPAGDEDVVDDDAADADDDEDEDEDEDEDWEDEDLDDEDWDDEDLDDDDDDWDEDDDDDDDVEEDEPENAMTLPPPPVAVGS